MGAISRRHQRTVGQRRAPPLQRSLGEPLRAFDWSRSELHPQKGLKNGRCNRTACQAPLADDTNWSMDNHDTRITTGRLYYCTPCARMFNGDDRARGMTLRCVIVEGDET